MKAVWKYQIPLVDMLDLQMPAGAQLLRIDQQHGVTCLWALVDPNGPMVTRRFRIVGTGHPIVDAPTGEVVSNFVYVGTYFMQERRLVWHVFDCGEIAP